MTNSRPFKKGISLPVNRAKKIFNIDIPKKLGLSIIFLVAIISLIILFIGYNNIRNKKIPENDKIHVPLFIDPYKIRYETRFNFTYDPMDVLFNFRESEKLDSIIRGCQNDFAVVIKLLDWTRKQWEPGKPDPYPPIDAVKILNEIRTGSTSGFCAQYNYVFVQALQSFGYKARYATIIKHEITEVWIDSLKKWICCDPLNNCWFTDNNNKPLSIYEIRDRIKHSLEVDILGKHSLTDIPKYFNKFKNFSIWLKNNHISSPYNFSDIEFYKVHFIDNFVIEEIIPKFALKTHSVKDLYYPPNHKKKIFIQK